MTKRKENTTKGRTKHIDIRLTEDEYTMVVKSFVGDKSEIV